MSSHTTIPFLDLVSPHLELMDELTAVFQQALSSAAFIGGPAVENFEKDFASFCDAQLCVGVASGTDALRFAIMAAGVKPGSVIVTVPNTFIATTEAITQAGCIPEFVDIDERTYNMDPEKLREYCQQRCRWDQSAGRLISRRSGQPVAAFIPVHLYGQTADMDPILELGDRYGATVIEDACQAHGAEYFSRREQRWRKAGSMGKAAAFSFYPGKNLGACGEGGAVTTNDPGIARQIRMMRDHGQAKKYHHEIEGYNGRLDAIQAGLLRVKLKELNAWNETRRERARFYHELLGDAADAIGLPHDPAWARPVHHLYVIRDSDRDDLQAQLAAVKIGTGIHYPIPLHLQKAYEHLDYRAGDFPLAEAAATEILSLPMAPSLQADQQIEVARQIKAAVSRRKAGAKASVTKAAGV